MKRAIHPQAVPGEPRAVRWVTEAELPVGRVVSAPGTLGPLLEYGVLSAMLVERGGVWTWLASEHSWTDHGPRIRDAVAAAVDLDGWQIEGSDELLALVAGDVLAGQLASYIASHGGQISVVEARDGVVRLDFGGACEHCPAAGQTLRERIESSIQARYPGATVERVEPPRKQRRWLNLTAR